MWQAAFVLSILFISLYAEFEMDTFTDADGAKHSRFNVSIKKSSLMK